MPRLVGFAERRHEPLYPTAVLTQRQLDLVRTMRDFQQVHINDRGQRVPALPWLRPMDIGARDQSHHTATLRQLIGKKLVERRARGSDVVQTAIPAPRRRGRHASRESYLYRLTEIGSDPRLVLRGKR